MFNLKVFNKIAPEGLKYFGARYKETDTLKDANCVILRSADLNTEDLPDTLLAIARAGAGTNNIPVAKCSQNGIVVFNTPGANANAVKELVIMSMLMAARNIPYAMRWTTTLSGKNLSVAEAVEKNKSRFSGHELYGKTLGVVGLGAIGVLVANASEDLGMKVVGYDPYMSPNSAHVLSNTVKIHNDLNRMLSLCDYITIHVPYSKATEGMISAETLKDVKDTAILLNFSRDKIVVENDVLQLLEEDKLGTYVTDFPNETVLNHDRVMCIPHLGASTEESEVNCSIMAAKQLTDYMENGNITNSVNLPNCSLGELKSAIRISIVNKNISGMLGIITGILADMKINIANLVNRSKGEMAYTLVDVDSHVDEDALREILSNEGIISVRFIYPTE